VLSGGQDSTTCLFWAREQFETIHALTFDYGQKHEREVRAALDVVSYYNCTVGKPARYVRHEVASLGPILHGTSPLVNSDARLEQYKNWQELPGGLEATFVPMRNTLFATIAANRAYCMGATDIVLGVCEEDYGGYPDCRQQFIHALAVAFGLSLDTNEFRIHTPLMYLTKMETVLLAVEMGVAPFTALAYTHTAYGNEYPPTGKDHATLLRAKGFDEAGVPDPLVLRALYEGKMQAAYNEPLYAPWKERVASAVLRGHSLPTLLGTVWQELHDNMLHNGR